MIYLIFAGYLFYPYFGRFGPVRYLIVANAGFAGVGVFVLSRRWLVSFAASVLAGALFAFGPFALSVASYHPSAGVIFALVPWLFCPAAFWTRRRPLNRIGSVIIVGLLSLLPFVTVILFFELLGQFGLFPIPKQIHLTLSGQLSLISPFAVGSDHFLVGLYHVPVAAFVVGLGMFFAGRRIGIIIIFAIGMFLSFCDFNLQASPIFWIAVPTLCCCIITGAGLEGLVLAGRGDRKWALAAGTISFVFAAVAILLGLNGQRIYFESAKLYALGVLGSFIIYFIARAQVSAHTFRWLILSAALLVDIVISSKILIAEIF